MAFTFSPHIAVQVKDYKAAGEFYRRVLGMQCVADEACSDSELALRKDAVTFYVEEGTQGRTFFEFRVDDMEQAEAALLEAGCVVTHAYNAKSKMIADPYGLRFHIWEGMAPVVPPIAGAAPHRDYLLRCIASEIEECIHLYATIPEGSLLFRPQEHLPSVEELLRCIECTGVAALAQCLDSADTSRDVSHVYAERSSTLTAPVFPMAMRAQMHEIRARMAEVSDTDLVTRMVHTSQPDVAIPLGEAIVQYTIRRLAAVRAQLALYIGLIVQDGRNTPEAV